MNKIQIAPAISGAQSLEGAVYYIPEPFLPWLWPSLALLGIALQLLAVFAGKRLLLIGGFLLVLCGALPERDITLLAGDAAACLGLWFCIRP